MESNFDLQELIAEIKEHLRGMWRYRWWAAVVGWLVCAGGWFYVYSMPNVYLATAKVYLDTETLMDPMFQGLALRDDLATQAGAVSRALLTRPNLEAVARATDLHLRASTPQAMEQLITQLQQDINVRADTRRNTFDISFEDENRSKAREVVAEIVNAFVENSLQGQGEDAEMTARAVEAEISNHEQRLLAAEDRLANFKKQNLGYMPDDRGDYYGRLQALLTDLEGTELEIDSLERRRDELKRQLASESPVLAAGNAEEAITATCSQQAKIAELKGQLAGLELTFTDRHPRIQSTRETIATLVAGCEREWETMQASGSQPLAPGNDAVEASPVYQNMRILLTNTEVELASLAALRSQQTGEVAELRRDVDKIADVEKELKQLNRDYDVVLGRYQELLRRRETLQSKERLSPVTDIIPFRTLEPPFAAAQPTGPDRPILILVVLFLSLGAGVALSFGLNQLNPVFFTRRSVNRLSGLPVLGSVSALRTPLEEKREFRMALIWAGSYVFLLLVAGVVIKFQGPASTYLRTVLGTI